MLQNERWLTRLVVLAACVAGLAGITGSLQESLWLDELHTAWCVSGSASQVAERAALGNQLSPFFSGLWVGSQLWGVTQWSLRAPALLAWLLAVAVLASCLARLANQVCDRWLMVVVVVVLTDRIQWFYATEARVYSLLALVNLLAWLALKRWSDAWFTSPERPTRFPLSWWCVWWLLLVVECWLQPTAVLMVVPHFIFLVGLWLTKWRRASWRSDGSSITVAGLLIVVLLLPAIGALWPVWQQRQLWAAFAARHDWIAIRALLPWEALCLPVMAAGCLWRFTGRRSSPLEREVTEPSASVNQALGRSWWMWLCAWCLPCLCVYLLSVSDWAALMHRRYVFAASLPLAMWLAIHLCRLPTTGRRLLVLAFSLVALWYQQGSLAILASGRWPTAERGEDWREAVAWINDQATAGEPAWIFCASSLIEAAEPQAVLQAVSNSPEEQWTSDSSASDRSSYLTFPLRTIYRLRPAVHLVPLANDPKSWPASWRQVGRPRASPIWLVVRCHARALPARLAAAGMVGGEHRDFGGVQVIRNVGFKD